MYFDLPLHPEFNAYWAEHKGLVFHMAKRLAIPLRTTRSDLVGTLVFLFNYTVHKFDPERGRFSPLFCRGCRRFVLSYWMRYESQSWSQFVRQNLDSNNCVESNESLQNYASHEVNFHLYRVPEEDESDVERIVSFFEGADECWAFMTRGMIRADLDMLTDYYRNEMHIDAMTEKYMVSKQRIYQRIGRAKMHVRDRLRLVREFADLFAARPGDESPAT